MPVDDTIQHIQAEPNRASSIPEIHVFELDGRLYSVNNRRLYAFRVRYPRGDNGKSQITRLGTPGLGTPGVRYPRAAGDTRQHRLTRLGTPGVRYPPGVSYPRG